VLARAFAQGGTTVAVSANVPGPAKLLPGVNRLVATGLAALDRTLALTPWHAQSDLLGPFRLAHTAVAPAQAKAAAAAVEASAPWGRLLDVDVYDARGVQVDRAALGQPPRPCLLCAEPAVDCMRLGRHGLQDLLGQAERLLAPFRPEPGLLRPEALAAALARGARQELDLTPKPGLVDRRDCGSHPDLSYALMGASIDLLPRYYDELLRTPFPAAIAAGRAAEARMVAAVGANAHKGYLFLSGLVLLAAVAGDGRVASLRAAVADLAGQFFAQHPPVATHGAGLRSTLHLGGIRAEAERGLPAVFETGWPAYGEALRAGWSAESAGHYLMAVLMQQVEDTTTIRRGGLEGLQRLRRDGALVQRRLERDQDAGALLAGLNEDYRRLGLTMGGVADCMALTFALEAFSSAG